MDRERWRQIDRIFQSALERPEGERTAFVAEACAGDEELRREVESLIAHDRERSLFEAPSTAELASAARALGGVGVAPEVGESVGRYRVTGSLGTGGMGEVFLARDERLNRPAALKLLSDQLTSDDERVRRFRQEALAASALNHPNIITIYEIGEWRGRDFIATEFVEGVTLRRRMSKRKLKVAEALDIALQIASALSAAHGAGIVHRDIKPENVMVRPDGLVKVLDFGIAKYTEPAGGGGSREALVKTATGAVIGTAAYMSPEQARGQETDARTDVWALGVILYEMVARRLPFPGQTPTDRIAAIITRDPDPLSSARRGVPEGLEAVVSRALAKEKERRYAGVEEMAADLRSVRASLGADTPEGFAAVPAARTALARTRPRALLVAAGLLAVAALIVAAGFYRRAGDDGGGAKAIDSLAVLPFANAGGDAEAEYFSDGITESLINSLSELPNLKVMSRNSVFRYKGREADAREVARTLGVRAVLTGRVAQRGDQLLVSVDLVDASDNTQVWGEQYNRRAADVLSVQQEIARDISQRLRLKLSGEQVERATRSYTDNVEAYREYLRGRFEWHRFTPDGVARSIEHFKRAIDIDPGYALAYAGLADGYGLETHFGAVSTAEGYPRARVMAEKAVALDPELAEAHAALGSVRLFESWDFAGAEESLRRAVQLNPNYSESRLLLAGQLCAMGRIDEAKVEVRRALEIDPLSLFAHSEAGQVFYFAREYDEALAHGRRGSELGTHFLLYHLLARALVQKGAPLEAAAELRKGMEIFGRRNPVLVASLAQAHAAAGQRAEARKLLDEMKEEARTRYVQPYWLAVAHAGLGDTDRAFELLNRAADERFFLLIWLNVEPRFDRLRKDPRYAPLARRIGLPAQ